MFADVKSPASRRTLALPAFLLELLAAHLAARGRPGPDELVFVAPGGGPLRRTLFRTRVFDPAKRRAGLDDSVTFHALRHSAVGLMIEVGAHIEAIKQRLGHSSIRTTSDVYGSLFPAADSPPAPRRVGGRHPGVGASASTRTPKRRRALPPRIAALASRGSPHSMICGRR
jgi:integrase